MRISQPFAGFEFSHSEIETILTILMAIVGVFIAYVSLFTAYLVKGAQQLHRQGRLRHPLLVVATSIALCLAGSVEGVRAAWAPYSLALGLALGYVVMLRAGTSWFRWTAAPASVFVFLMLAAS